MHYYWSSSTFPSQSEKPALYMQHGNRLRCNQGSPLIKIFVVTVAYSPMPPPVHDAVMLMESLLHPIMGVVGRTDQEANQR